jgi:hypothetical protein
MATTEKPPEKPTTVRLGEAQAEAISRICKICNITQSALINLAVSAFADHVERTGKLPVPKLKKGKRGGANEPAG